MRSIGTLVGVRSIDYKRNVMATMRWTNEWVPQNSTPKVEYLFLVRK
ncbi:MAG: hypothetical protein SPI77_00545 [Corynebacterium sp.]|nr:hypothetical protein [Corynebacterium sp.]